MRSPTTASPARPWPLAGLALLGLLGASPSQGAVPLASATIRVIVTVVEKPSCVFNDNRPVEVDFGELVITKIDGSQYKRLIDYRLECSNAQDKSVRMRIKGVPASFDVDALRTDVEGLGIKVYAQDTVLAPGQDAGFVFVYPNKPQIQAVPVKSGRGQLTGGEFFAAATMELDYP